MLEGLALAAARRAERAMGPSAAVSVIRAAIETSEGEPQRTLLLAGLGAAVRAHDASAFAQLAARWETSGGNAAERRGLSFLARLEQNGDHEWARMLARAEAARYRSEEAVFVLGVIAERDGAIERAVGLWREASELAPGTEVARRSERAALRHAPPERADDAERALSATRDPGEIVRLAPAALQSARLYARVRTLDRLLEHATDPTLSASVLRVALAHADLRGSALGPLERDRIVAIATAAGAPTSVLAALHGRAPTTIDEAATRDALLGHPPASEGVDHAATLALRAIAAATTDDPSSALLISALAAHPPTPAGWTAVLLGLARPRSRATAVACAERWLDAGVAPPRGFSVLAAALARAEQPAAAERALVQAARANERGARAALGVSLERRARAAHAAGDRAAAKTLLERALAIDPDEA